MSGTNEFDSNIAKTIRQIKQKTAMLQEMSDLNKILSQELISEIEKKVQKAIDIVDKRMPN